MKAYINASVGVLRVATVVVSLMVLQGQFFSVSPSSEYILRNPVTPFLACMIPLLLVVYSFRFLPSHLDAWIAGSSGVVKEWIAGTPQKNLQYAVAIVAGLSLFLELVLIRWQTGLFPIFALYKNFILLACFCGIGLGYALAQKKTLLLAAGLPLMAMSVLLMTVLRYGSDDFFLLLLQSPRMETGILRIMFDDMGPLWGKLSLIIAILLLSGSFLLNALILLPVAQFCGALMDRLEKPLTSYGFNLLGSIGGTIVLFVLSLFWGGPVIWFGIIAAILLWYQMVADTARKAGLLSAAIIICTLAWPVDPMVQNVYSPYQLIQKTTQKNSGLTWLLGSGSYHQHAHDLSSMEANHQHIGFFELAYNNAPSVDRVLIIGSGIGNDVSAALHAHAKSVDAVEIDPAIVSIGRKDHPESPYQDARVHTIIDDGRGFLRDTNNRYDLITYGIQDTTIVMSHGTNVRFDTYLFTKQGLLDAYSKLAPGGVMSVAFMFPKDTIIDNKIYRILEGFPETPGIRVITLAKKSKDLLYVDFLIRKGDAFSVSADYLKKNDLRDITNEYERQDKTAALSQIDLPTDDWPFFLMENKTFPSNYIVSSALVLLLSLFLVKRLLSEGRGCLDRSLVPFFFLGAGFMLVETKAISELALLFGNTWQVIAITILGVLIMAYCANLFVARWVRTFLVPAFAGLLLVIVGGYAVIYMGGLPHHAAWEKLSSVALLVSPLFFSGIIFSTLFKNVKNVSGAMAYNIMGAMLGGVLEYTAMLFGFSTLYLIALGAYGLAGMSAIAASKQNK